MRDDRGYATVLAAGILLALVALLGTLLYCVSLIHDAHVAQRAADLAAVAGAWAVYLGREGCDVAADIVARNGGAVTECIVRGDDLTIIVRVGSRTAVSTAGPTVLL